MDSESLRLRLGNLRVPDLKQIATSCNLRATGKKGDIIERILTHTAPQLLLGVIERMGKGQVLQPALYATGPASAYDDGVRANSKVRTERKREIDLTQGVPSQSVQLRSAQEPITVINCPLCSVPYHDRCLAVSAGELPEGFSCPKCRMQDLDPFFPAVKILHLMPLWEDVTTSANVQARRSLPLQSPNIQDLRRKGAEVYIYCLRLNNWKSPKLHEWPLTVTVNINKNQEVIKKPEYEHKRRDIPMKVTPYLTGEGQNNIEVLATNFEAQDPYVVALCLCDRRTADQLQQWVLLNKRLPSSEAEAKTMDNIRSFFGGSRSDDDEVDILDTSCRVRLVDPISLMRLNIPVRGRNCRHLQCFDLGAFLEVTRSTKAFANRWKCVECNSVVRPSDLVVDTYIEHLLQQTSKEAEGVVFDAQGQWEEIQGTAVAADSPSDPVVDEPIMEGGDDNEKIDLVDLSSGSDDEAQLIVSRPPPPPMPKQEILPPPRRNSVESLASNTPFFAAPVQQQQRRQSIEILPPPRRSSLQVLTNSSAEPTSNSLQDSTSAARSFLNTTQVSSHSISPAFAPKVVSQQWDSRMPPPAGPQSPATRLWSMPQNQQRVTRDFQPPNPFLMQSAIASSPNYGPPISAPQQKANYTHRSYQPSIPPDQSLFVSNDYMAQSYTPMSGTGQQNMTLREFPPSLQGQNSLHWMQQPVAMQQQPVAMQQQSSWANEWNLYP